MAVTQLAWVAEEPGNKSKDELSLYNENGLRSRRFHHKSRKGCKGCKQRRVKCDEGEPECTQCRDKCIKCEYTPGSRPLSASEVPRNDQQSQPGITSDPAISSRIMQILIESNAPCTELEKTAIYRRNHALEVIDHFATCQDPWLGSPTCQRILQEHGIRLGLNAGHLVHAIIAISAAYLAARQTTDEERKKFWVASTLHYHHSLGMYSSAIVHSLHEQDADAIFASGLLHAMLAFMKTPKASEHIALEEDKGPTWIMSMQGIRTLIDTPGLRTRLEDGVWRPFIVELDRWNRITANDLGHSGSQFGACTIGALKEVCDVEPTSPYVAETESQLAMLDKLFHLDATHHDIDGFLAFMTNATPACIGRLRADDEKALLVLSYWCAMFGQIKQWWITKSAMIECIRICAHLGKSEDPRIRALLAFPANTCGYELRDRPSA